MITKGQTYSNGRIRVEILNKVGSKVYGHIYRETGEYVKASNWAAKDFIKNFSLITK